MDRLVRNYKIRAIAKNGDSHLVMTDDRQRALGYYQAMISAKHWQEVRIEVGVEFYGEKNLGELP